LRAALAELFKRLVDVVHGEHDAEVAWSVHRGVAVIRDDRRREETGELETAVAVRCAHHGNLDALVGKSGDTSCPFSFDRGPPFEVKAELLKEINCQFEVIDDDSYVIQPFERHASNLTGCRLDATMDAVQSGRITGSPESAGINRHVVGDARALQERK